ncbi:MAG: heavy-metal-associated domain-containing protein [Anaerolineae bacterium]|nr:heavy-metal-associated domain-containing protein [Anaerolineae bacterium]
MNKDCYVDPIQKTATREERESVKQILLTVRGMGYSNCAIRVHNSLAALKGVINAHVEFTTETAEVEFNPHIVAIPTLIDAVAEAGRDGRHAYSAALLIE